MPADDKKRPLQEAIQRIGHELAMLRDARLRAAPIDEATRPVDPIARGVLDLLATAPGGHPAWVVLRAGRSKN